MNSQVVRSVAIFGILTVACVCACQLSEGGRPDDELGGLIVAPDDEPPDIDVGKAAGDPMALSTALATPHRRVYAVLGPHSFKGTSSVQIVDGKDVVDSLSDTTEIAIDGDGNFRAILDNSKDYGRHVIYVADTMYLRPRFGKYHKRPPADPGEMARVRDEIFATLGAYFEPLAARAELSDAGATTAGKRAARLIKIKTAPSVKDAQKQRLDHKKWRETAVPEAIEGEVLLDAETGVPLKASLTGSVGFVRKDRSLSMKLTVTHEIIIGAPAPITAPPEEETVTTYTRLKEVDDRETLLEGIAPPAKKPPTPNNPTGESTTGQK